MGKKQNQDRVFDASEQFQPNHTAGSTGDKGKVGLSRHSLCNMNPKTENHKAFVEAFYNSTAEVFIVTGYPGTAKTFLSMWMAFDDVFEGDGYHKVSIFRSPVESRDTGFKPGTEEEKASVFEKPYKSLIFDLFPDAGASTYNFLKEKGKLSFELTSNQRGVTLHNQIVIIDEVQNMDFREALGMITRKGRNCKIILCGDFAQDDLSGDRRNAPSCLSKLMRVFKRMDPRKTSVHSFYDYDDIVRDDWVKDFIIATVEEEKENPLN